MTTAYDVNLSCGTTGAGEFCLVEDSRAGMSFDRPLAFELCISSLGQFSGIEARCCSIEEYFLLLVLPSS